MKIDGKQMRYDGKWRFSCPSCGVPNVAATAPFLVSSYECSGCNRSYDLKHPGVASSKVWLPCEIQYLEIEYPLKHNDDICQELGRPMFGLQTKASELGIHKEAGFFDIETGACWRGRESHPFNPQSDGAISVRRYHDDRNIKYVRISSGVWKPLHHQRWQEANGDVPEGYMLSFKDGDSMNAVLENLELISRKQHIKKNTFNRFPLWLQQQIQLAARLERKIKSNAQK